MNTFDLKRWFEDDVESKMVDGLDYEGQLGIIKEVKKDILDKISAKIDCIILDGVSTKVVSYSDKRLRDMKATDALYKSVGPEVLKKYSPRAYYKHFPELVSKEDKIRIRKTRTHYKVLMEFRNFVTWLFTGRIVL